MDRFCRHTWGRCKRRRGLALSTKGLTATAVLILVVGGSSAIAQVGPDEFRREQWGMDKIGANVANTKFSGDGVIVAVIDSGIDLDHEDLKAAILQGHDYVDGDEDARDENGHGTHVAGIIAAQRNNRVGIEGVAPGAKLLPLRVLAANGEGLESNVAAAVERSVQVAAAQGRKLVINLSLVDADVSVTAKTPLIARAINDAWLAGAVIVAAAGNNSLPFAGFPSGSGRVISVGASDRTDAVTSFSNRGVSLVAPGLDVISTFWGKDEPERHNQYARTSGTSMAAPLVAGAAALLLSAGYSNSQTVERILGGADDIGKPGFDPESGYGRLNVARSLGLNGNPVELASIQGLPRPPETRNRVTSLAALAFLAAFTSVIGSSSRRPKTAVEAAMSGIPEESLDAALKRLSH